MSSKKDISELKKLEFKELVSYAINQGCEQALANEMEVHKSTVARWAHGVACPLPSIKKIITDTIYKLLNNG